MERSFIVTKESKYYKDFIKNKEMAEKQRNFVKDFLKEHGIESKGFLVGGDGGVGMSFDDYDKKEIRLSIVPTENDIFKFGKQLTKVRDYGLQSFKKNSSIAKDFAQQCVDNKIVINLPDQDLRFYFKSMNWSAYRSQRIPCNEGFYIKIDCELLKEDDTPEGFKEIKLSEFYKALEKYNANNK